MPGPWWFRVLGFREGKSVGRIGKHALKLTDSYLAKRFLGGTKRSSGRPPGVHSIPIFKLCDPLRAPITCTVHSDVQRGYFSRGNYSVEEHTNLLEWRTN